MMINWIALILITGGLWVYKQVCFTDRVRNIRIEMIEPSESSVVNPDGAEKVQSNG